MAKKKAATIKKASRVVPTRSHRLGRPPEIQKGNSGTNAATSRLTAVPGGVAGLAQMNEEDDEVSIFGSEGTGNGKSRLQSRGRPAGEPYEKITVVLSLAAVVKLDRFLVDLREKGQVASRADVIRRLVLEVDLAEMAEKVWGIEL